MYLWKLCTQAKVIVLMQTQVFGGGDAPLNVWIKREDKSNREEATPSLRARSFS